MKKRKIGELVAFVRGISYKKDQAKKEKEDGYTTVLRANNINDGKFNYEDLVYVPTVLIKSDQIINKGDIVITMSSGSKAHVGKVAIAQTDTDVVYGAFCAKIVPKEINPLYLYYVLRDGSFRRHIETASKGTNINNLKQEYILDYEILLPTFIEQQRIVTRIEELFSELDKGVETLRTIQRQLAVYRQAVLKEAFPPATSENTMVLEQIADISGGITKGRKLEKKDTIQLPYLRVANVQNGYLDLSEMKTIELRSDEKSKYLLKYGDVLYTEGGDRDKLGRGTIWRDEIEECVHQNHIFKARVNEKYALPEYVALWSMNEVARKYFYDKGKQTVNLASINKTVLSLLPIPLPSIAKQKEIIEKLQSRLSVCDSIERTVETALAQSDAMRQSILKQAFEGGFTE